LYPRGVFYLTEKQVVGKVAGMIPYAGYLTIVLNDYPMLKFLVLGGMMLSVIMSKDPNN
jgi:signal peptidase I